MVVEQYTVSGFDCVEFGGAWCALAPVDAACRIAVRRVTAQGERVADSRRMNQWLMHSRERIYHCRHIASSISLLSKSTRDRPL